MNQSFYDQLPNKCKYLNILTIKEKKNKNININFEFLLQFNSLNIVELNVSSQSDLFEIALELFAKNDLLEIFQFKFADQKIKIERDNENYYLKCKKMNSELKFKKESINLNELIYLLNLISTILLVSL